jgi:hypothetical protein
VAPLYKIYEIPLHSLGTPGDDIDIGPVREAGVTARHAGLAGPAADQDRAAAHWWQWPVEVASTWLMPWRAVRTIREQREDMRLLTQMLALGSPRTTSAPKLRHLHVVR